MQVNKAIAAYVKNNKIEIQKLLDNKFGLSLSALASGNYDNPSIKLAALDLLEAKMDTTALADAIKNPENVITNHDVTSAIDQIRFLLKVKEFNRVAAILGSFNNFYSTNRFTFNLTRWVVFIG